MTHPQDLGTEHCGASASPARCRRAPGVLRVLESLLRFVLKKDSVQWNPGPRSLEKPECNSHQGFHHSVEARGNLAWQRCSRANDCIGWGGDSEGLDFFFFLSSFISVGHRDPDGRKTKLTSDTQARRAGTKPDQKGRQVSNCYRAGLHVTHDTGQGSQATVLSSPTSHSPILFF